MNNTVYKKKICMTEFHIGKLRFDSLKYVDVTLGQPNSAFIYVCKGELTISSVGKSLCIPAGGFLFIPEGIRYSAVWRGTPEIEYYSLRIISKKTDISYSSGRYALQRISDLDPDILRTRIDEIYSLFTTGERPKLIRALGLYYCLYAEILPVLTVEPQRKYSSALITATKYIDENYTDDTPVDTLAAMCHISESRLYHLFKSELSTTPIKYRNSLRIGHACAELRTTELGIDEIADHNGFNSAAYFRETFKSETGLTPTQYRSMSRQAEGER